MTFEAFKSPCWLFWGNPKEDYRTLNGWMAEKKVMKLYTGTVNMAASADVDVIPVAIDHYQTVFAFMKTLPWKKETAFLFRKH